MKSILLTCAILLAAPLNADINYGGISITDGGRLDSGEQLLSVDFTLNDNWHSYWEYAGQNGLAPHFNFEGSTNIADISNHWPKPHLIGDEGVEAVGYSEDFRMVIKLTPENAAEPIHLKMHADIGVCNFVCIPVQIDFETELTPIFSPDGFTMRSLMKSAFDTNPCSNERLTDDDWLLYVRDGRGILRSFKTIASHKIDSETAFVINKRGAAKICN